MNGEVIARLACALASHRSGSGPSGQKPAVPDMVPALRLIIGFWKDMFSIRAIRLSKMRDIKSLNVDATSVCGNRFSIAAQSRTGGSNVRVNFDTKGKLWGFASCNRSINRRARKHILNACRKPRGYSF